MTVKEVDGKWYTVNKAGKVGKRGFSSKANAQAAQDRGRARARSSPLQLAEVAADQAGEVFSEIDTAAERKALGIPPKPTPRREF
jgi:hypothetical protein